MEKEDNMDNLNKILNIVEKTGKEIIISRENGECFVISPLRCASWGRQFSDFDKTTQNRLDFNEKSEDDYLGLIKKTIMP